MRQKLKVRIPLPRQQQTESHYPPEKPPDMTRMHLSTGRQLYFLHPARGKEGQEFYKYERLILQMIVRYGEKIMCNATNDEGQEVPISVIEYVINDLKEDELSFHNPLHRQILTEAAAHIHDEGFTAERYFWHILRQLSAN